MQKYHKINGLYSIIEGTRLFDTSKYSYPEIDYLKDLPWKFTEKVDGTNVRVIWNGYGVNFLGRNDDSDIPEGLNKALFELFMSDETERIFEQKFGEKEVILFGEGYGGKVQAHKHYREKESFILFDVMVNGVMLKRENVEEIAHAFNIEVVPIIMVDTIEKAVQFVKTKPRSVVGGDEVEMEGLVGTPVIDLYGRGGKRVIVKIKVKDLLAIERQTQQKGIE